MRMCRTADAADSTSDSDPKTAREKAPPAAHTEPERDTPTSPEPSQEAQGKTPDVPPQPNPGQIQDDEDQEWRRAGGGTAPDSDQQGRAKP